MVDCNATVPEECRGVTYGGSSPSYIFALWNLLIRPPRANYSMEQLGPASFQVRGHNVQREDLRLRTRRGAALACSFFIPERAQRTSLKMPVIIYLHGNSSSRLEAGSILLSILECGMALFCYDASGCGQSEGEYVSLGWHERDDLAVVINHIRSDPQWGSIGIWGRSMGAVTALLHADRDASIGAMCVDSPFANLRQLMEELACGQHALVPLPSFLVRFLMGVIKERVKTLADFDIDDLVPLEHAKRSHVPALFLHGVKDTFISENHAHQLFEAYAGSKELCLLDGDHNSKRGTDTITGAVRFFCQRFGWFAGGSRNPPMQVPSDQAPEKPKPSLGRDVASQHAAAHKPVLVEPQVAPSQKPKAPYGEEVSRRTEGTDGSRSLEVKPYWVRREQEGQSVNLVLRRARSVDARASGTTSEPNRSFSRRSAHSAQEEDDLCYALQGVGISMNSNGFPSNRGRSSRRAVAHAPARRSASWPPHDMHQQSSQGSAAARKTLAPKIMSRIMKKLRKPAEVEHPFERRVSVPMSINAARGGA
mmetsp:Transcript_48609/g.89566  ORF Transcript_48609/g.89566 Transcript_48609/m.89566 type:complete len:537 (+) Transcript_48609:76-1686(+)